MLYIHKTVCASPQRTFAELDLDALLLSRENRLHALEPSYDGIPPGQLRRMGKAVRLGVGTGMELLKGETPVDGIIIGTANGGMEDCIKFLNQIIEYEEGALTPTNFVQSTTNAIASQIAFMSKNKGYNITHVHRGLSFENALLDAMMKAVENPSQTFLLGGIDEISDYNFNIDLLMGCFKKAITSNEVLYDQNSDGTIAGEGAAMFIVNGISDNAAVKVSDLLTVQTKDETELLPLLKKFLSRNELSVQDIDLYISGENGDKRLDVFYNQIQEFISSQMIVARFKHACGEMPTATAIGLWYACEFLSSGKIPAHMLKGAAAIKKLNRILIYNCFQGLQHSFILIEKNS